jgi:serine/threonine-protein kinase
MDIPNFSEIREDVDERLNIILQLALQRPRDKRYQTADQMLTELENFIYGEGYGPTNEKLAAYTNDLFSRDGEKAALRWHNKQTPQIIA